VIVGVQETAPAKIVKIKIKEPQMANSKLPVQPAGSVEQVPEFISSMPDPSTGLPREEAGDADTRDNVYSSSVVSGHYGAATFDGDMGRLSKI
jgi:hypothetical protein